MKRLNWLLILFFLLFGTQIFAQKVPTYMEFADIKLKISEGAKRQIQKDVDMLTRSPKYFGIKVKRANLYFPIIERIFKEEGLPDDFKYLVLQESALIPDAVSSSNAVGFWQFKKAAAKEVDLRVDGAVDERMNIVSASRGAAKYLKKYNSLFFKNWLYSLQAYNVGPGGALRSLDKKNFGAKRMVIDKKTHWYVKKYLSHKIAFEPALKSGKGTRQLAELTSNRHQSLRDINKKYGVDIAVLQDYNKWLKSRRIPDDKTYTVVVPVDNNSNKRLISLVKNGDIEPSSKPLKSDKYKPVLTTRSVDYNMGMDFPKIKKKVIRKSGLSYTLVNGIPGMVARAGSSVKALAERGGISSKKFRKHNDLSAFDKIIPGQVYYFKRKKSKSKIHYYGAKRNESLWAISQKFGIRMDKLMARNGILRENDLKAGRVLWLRSERPEGEPVEFISLPEERPAEEQPVIVKNTSSENQKNRTVTRHGGQGNSAGKVTVTSKTAPVTRPKENIQKQKTPVQKPVVESPETEDIWEDEDENARWLNEEKKPAEKDDFSVKEEVNVNIIDQKNPDSEDEFDIDEGPKFINTPAPSSTIENGQKIHVIKQGETLFSIARTYNITVQELQDWNGLEELGNIKFDQKLIVGKVEKFDEHVQNNRSQSERGSIILHEVEEGDTIFSISKTYNVPIQKILELNQKTDYKIAIGEKLKLVKNK